MMGQESLELDPLALGEADLPDRSVTTSEPDAADSEGSLALALLRHELAQPLTHLVTLLDLSTTRVERAAVERDAALQELEELLAAAREATAHLSSLVRRIGQIAPRRPTQAFDVGSMIESALAICSAALSERATVTSEFLVKATVHGVADELRQLLLNVLTNAALAIESGTAHDNRISIRVYELCPMRVAIEVSDTGVGVPAALRECLLDPWITTRADRGSGLGLAVCAQIVESFHGELSFADRPEGGTTVRIVMPAVHVEAVTGEP
jgi:C4-dicarboxylate-specific signal transduction histidine kinase